MRFWTKGSGTSVWAAMLILGGTLMAQDLPYISEKRAAVESVQEQREALIRISDRIWRYAEAALLEKRSAEELASYLEGQGFRVQRGVAAMPTAFTAEYGSGKPIIGIMGEYDALPGLSQQASTDKSPLKEGAPGHGCGHNLFGTASAGAAVAVKEVLAKRGLSGTIRFYGTPAEENYGGKIYMVKAGLFDDVDVALAWHPNTRNQADVQSSQAIVDFKVDFFGKAAHAAFDPWNGRSALDGLDLFIHALNLMREHVRPTVRIHYVIEDGGMVPNIVPESARLWCWIRDSKRQGVAEVFERAKQAAQGAAMATGTRSKVRVVGGDYEVLPVTAGGRLMQANLEWIGPIRYTSAEEDFARRLQRSAGIAESGIDGTIRPWRDTLPEPEGGSTDVGDVSWVVPVINMTATTAPRDVPWHSWCVVASGGGSIGHKGMLLAAKALSATSLDMLLDAKALQAVRREWEEKVGGHVYQSFVPFDVPPIPR